MVAARACSFALPNGRACRADPMRERDFCFWHDPGTKEEAAEARRLGGLRRRREKTLAGAYELGGLASVGDIRRLLDIAVLDVLGLDNSISRARVLIAAATAAAKLLEVGELEDRVDALEHALKARRDDPTDGEPWSSHAA